MAHSRAPLRRMAFMDDAHRRGVLRQFGGVYQFRQSRLQDRLLAQAAPATATTSTTASDVPFGFGDLCLCVPADEVHLGGLGHVGRNTR